MALLFDDLCSLNLDRENKNYQQNKPKLYTVHIQILYIFWAALYLKRGLKK